ncbi:hypothetical protein [Polluticoccus soli]|uniref:hypothetical protein n=1 Tax=Polluticoccus soli TaxID=3034150 RepID=UPI0023E2324E|nr:hypothetical protein [Flavipsychrobacter sp. JY13-12]
MRFFFCFCFLAIFLHSCGFKEREQTIARKEQEIEVVQSKLLLKEQQLAEKEKALLARELSRDSTYKIADSSNQYEPRIVGRWLVKMNCTETTCEGSAIGDIKVEHWDIEYGEANSVTVKAYADKTLARIYNGNYNSGDGLRLAHENSINVSLSFTEKGNMEGTREINRPDCKIVYALSAEKAL